MEPLAKRGPQADHAWTLVWDGAQRARTGRQPLPGTPAIGVAFSESSLY
jgi:hypothetical protein